MAKRRPQHHGALSLYPIGDRIVRCDNHCRTVSNVPRLARWTEELAGHHSAELCEPCAKNAVEVWSAFTPNVAEKAA